jgi:hypothetical protein
MLQLVYNINSIKTGDPLYMKIAEILTETPQSIIDIGDDHVLNNKLGNIKLAREIQANKKKVLVKALAPNINFYELPEKYVVLDESNINVPRVIYFVWYKIQNLGYIARKAACQILVWKSIGYPDLLTGLPSYIFFNILLPKTGTIVTDYQQTNAGRRFWGDRISTALSIGKYVYYVNFQPDRVLQQITNIQQLEDLSPSIYGSHQKYKQRRLIITDHPISTPESD